MSDASIESARFVARRPGAGPDVAVSSIRRTDGGYPAEFGPLAPLVADPAVTDVFVNGRDAVWVDRGDGLARASIQLDEVELRELAVRLMSIGGRHIDEATPAVDARLGGGIRVHAVLAPISAIGTLLSVRLPRTEFPTLDSLDANGFFDLVSRDVVESFAG